MIWQLIVGQVVLGPRSLASCEWSDPLIPDDKEQSLQNSLLEHDTDSLRSSCSWSDHSSSEREEATGLFEQCRSGDADSLGSSCSWSDHDELTVQGECDFFSKKCELDSYVYVTSKGQNQRCLC